MQVKHAPTGMVMLTIFQKALKEAQRNAITKTCTTNIPDKTKPEIIMDKTSVIISPIVTGLIENQHSSSGYVNKDVMSEVVTEVSEEMGPEPVESNWQCGECGILFESSKEVNEHIDELHKDRSEQTEEKGYSIPEKCKECTNKDL